MSKQKPAKRVNKSPRKTKVVKKTRAFKKNQENVRSKNTHTQSGLSSDKQSENVQEILRDLIEPDHEAPPPPTIEGLSERTQRALTELAQAQTLGTPTDPEALNLALEALKIDLEGQSLGLLEETLDWIRDAGLYDLSLSLLEEAWSSDLPQDFLGRVAQDWVGSVLFGLADESGAIKVAHHLTSRAQELGPSFCSDLCDLWLEWGLTEVAQELALFVHERQPGEISALFHLMICAKLHHDWEKATHWLSMIDEHRAFSNASPDLALEWNRGLIAVKARQWEFAREAWKKVGFKFPETDQNSTESIGDYAQPGELSPVRLKVDLALVEASQGSLPRSEVVWGRRIGPARIELTGLPYYHPTYRCGDILLVDGIREGQVDFNGQTYPISPALEVWESSPGETLRLYGAHTRLKQVMALDQFTQALGEAGWAVAHWTRFVRRETPNGDQLLQLAVYLPPNRSIAEFAEALLQRQEAGQIPELYCPRYAELTGGDVSAHRQALIELGVIEH